MRKSKMGGFSHHAKTICNAVSVSTYLLVRSRHAFGNSIAADIIPSERMRSRRFIRAASAARTSLLSLSQPRIYSSLRQYAMRQLGHHPQLEKRSAWKNHDDSDAINNRYQYDNDKSFDLSAN